MNDANEQCFSRGPLVALLNLGFLNKTISGIRASKKLVAILTKFAGRFGAWTVVALLRGLRGLTGLRGLKQRL